VLTGVTGNVWVQTSGHKGPVPCARVCRTQSDYVHSGDQASVQ